jgi:hypothetical protein
LACDLKQKGANVPYTVWSRGRLLGRTTLGYAPSLPWIRAGNFEPTDAGELLLPILTGMGPALEALASVLDAASPVGKAPGGAAGRVSEALRLTTEYADVLSLNDQLEHLALELRDAQGELVRTACIGVQDTEHILALARRDGVLLDDEEVELEPWQARPARYQIIVELEGCRSRTDMNS